MQIKVNLGKRTYPVVVSSGPAPMSYRQIGRINPDRILVVFDANLFALHGKVILADLRKTKRPVSSLVVPFNELSKNLATVLEIHDWLLSEQISRTDLIIACGGGVTTDVVGYAAGTILRGVQWGAIPTTLVGMVDAAIGGKTGVNHPRAKNVIGAFWQPRFVYAHTPFLKTLMRRELFAGAGELVKYAGLIGGRLMSDIESLVADRCEVSDKRWVEIIEKAVSYKSKLVSKDERDTGVRQFLNLGHTFGHSIEQSLNYRSLLHGEAVLIGLYAAIKLSGMTYKGVEKRLESYQRLVETAIRFVPYSKLDQERILSAMQLDKKRLGRKLQFILLKRPGAPVVTSDVSESAVRSALAEVIEFYKINGGRGVTNSHNQRA